MSNLERELSKFVQDLANKEVFSGTVLLAHKDEPIFQVAYGLADRNFDIPNTLDTKFNLGSINKIFTSIAIAQLVERGQLSFEDNLATFLPDFHPSSGSKIKIKHLLTHTAGLGYYFSDRFWNSSRLLYRTIDDMMNLVADEELLFDEPGSQWQYSNTGMLVLGKVIECVSKQSYYQYIQENIYNPAAMHNSGSYELDKVNKNLAVPYSKVIHDDHVEIENTLFKHIIRGGPHGGGFSTTEDLLKFSLALQSNQLLKEENVKLALSAKPELNSPDYGFGFIINKELAIAGHNGGFPGVYGNLDMFLNTAWTAVVLSNQTVEDFSIGGSQIVTKIRELLVAEDYILPLTL